jgi:hypothetical protein
MEQEMTSAGMTAPRPSGYEFTAQQNLTIDVLAKRMKFIGILNLIFGGFMALGGILILFKTPIQGFVAFAEVAFFVLMGLWNYRGAASFQLIVQTQGKDIAHLMNALEELRKIYNLQYWLMIVMLVLVALGIVALVLMSMSAAT